MTDKDALELLNMFATAAQIAKSKNQHEFHLKMDEATLIALFKKAFPSMQNNINTINIVKNLLNN